MSNSKRQRVQTVNNEPSMTQQQFKNQCDINLIIKKFEKTGMVTHLSGKSGQYGDFSSIKDFQSNLNSVISAQNAFDSLPAAIRKRFGNDPAQLIDFVHNDANYEEAEKLGLVPKKPDSASAPNDDQTTITQEAPVQA